MKAGLWRLAAFARDQRGGVSVLTALALPALIGSLALGTEVSFWMVKNRRLQNAADSAVIAASIAGGANYLAQAKAVTARYGLIDGADGVTVTASNAATCPTGETNCYRVTVATSIPVYLGAVVGYLGNTVVDGAKSTSVSANAIAKPGGTAKSYCLVGLASDGTTPAIASSGAPKADLSGCGVASNTAARCNGHDLKAAFGDAVGTNNGCGAIPTSNAKPFVDPYAALVSRLPADACGGQYPQITNNLPNSNKWLGTKSLGSVTTICGDLQLTGAVTVTAPSNAVLIIRNGRLDTNGYKLQTANGSGLAIVFTGVNNALYTHTPTGSGDLDIAAPTTGDWSGVAIYTNPSLTVGVQMPKAASDPTWAISGLIYTPRANLEFKGSVGKGTNGKLCTVIVANSVTIKGTGLVLSTMECGIAGLSAPTNGASGRGVLAG